MTRYLEMAERLFPHLQKRDGTSESELKAAEKRLGFPLPAELRAMYRLAGRRRDLHAAHDRLALPINLITVNKALVFYEAADRTAAWAIRRSDIALGTDDPPVVTAHNEPPFAWASDHDTVSGFFFTELLWQHVNAEPHTVVDASPGLLARIRERFAEIPLPGCHWDVLGCWGLEGAIVMERGTSESDAKLYVGATSDEELARVTG
jgi:hypothetical protein